MKTPEEILKEKLKFIYFENSDKAYHNVLSAMEEYAAQFKSEWISVLERKPEHYRYGKRQKVWIGWIGSDRIYIVYADQIYDCTATHWHLVPQPPKI